MWFRFVQFLERYVHNSAAKPNFDKRSETGRLDLIRYPSKNSSRIKFLPKSPKCYLQPLLTFEFQRQERQAFERSFACSLDQSLTRTTDRSLNRLAARLLDQLLYRALARSLDHSLDHAHVYSHGTIVSLAVTQYDPNNNMGTVWSRF